MGELVSFSRYLTSGWLSRTIFPGSVVGIMAMRRGCSFPPPPLVQPAVTSNRTTTTPNAFFCIVSLQDSLREATTLARSNRDRDEQFFSGPCLRSTGSRLRLRRIASGRERTAVDADKVLKLL